MTTWTISVADTFFNELLNLPQSVQKRVSRSIRVLESDPISANGDAKKLKGYTNNVYRIRLGDYRLFYSFGQGWVKLLSIRKRDDRTYEIELPQFEIPTPPPIAASLEPQPEPTYSTPEITTTLPAPLTESLLQQWHIPAEYWATLTAVQSSEALLDLPIPDRYLSRILDNLYPRAIDDILTQREYLLQTPEDLDRFVEGSLTAFLLKLDPEQEKLTQFSSKGPTLVKGGPGTGKSTLALYRVKTLLESGKQPILFTTYTKALTTYSEQLLEQLLHQSLTKTNVTVSTVDALAYHYYTQRYKAPRFPRPDQSLALLEAALQNAPITASNAFDRQVRLQTLQRLGATYLLQEIEDVIEAWGIPTLDSYLNHDRRGRGVPLKANIREAIWSVYLTWKTLLTQKRFTTWHQLRLQAYAIAQQLANSPYQAIIIDEAQDLPPVALRFLLALVPSLEQVYLTADASQSLYQRGFSWKQIHSDLKVAGRTIVLRRNYRNTQEIAIACATILQNTEAGDAECVEQELSPHRGEPPAIAHSDDLDTQIQTIRTFFIQSAQQFRLPIHSSAVLVPTADLGRAIARKLIVSGLKAEFVAGDKLDLNAPHIKVLTLHSAKGLEFPFVAIAGLQEGILPTIEPNLPADENSAVLDEQRRLFYVGCSRAMRSLLVCGSQSQPSQFLDFLTFPNWKR